MNYLAVGLTSITLSAFLMCDSGCASTEQWTITTTANFPPDHLVVKQCKPLHDRLGMYFIAEQVSPEKIIVRCDGVEQELYCPENGATAKLDIDHLVRLPVPTSTSKEGGTREHVRLFKTANERLVSYPVRGWCLGTRTYDHRPVWPPSGYYYADSQQ